jgi:hypothetical protein
MKKLLREPLLHFLVLGAVLFAFNAWRQKTRPMQAPARQIEVTAAVIGRLRSGYERQFSRAPNEAELREVVTAHIREEVLCREALALGLDRDDTIVRRRLAQKMEFLTDDIAGAVGAEDAAVREFFEKNVARYTKPGRVTFRHVFFSTAKRGPATEVAVGEALAALRKGANDDAFGDPFLHGYAFAEREQDDVIAAFGAEFAKQLAAQPLGVWRGPVESSYGVHLVRVETRMEPRAAKFDEVRLMVTRDLNDERRRAANSEVFERLRKQYRVLVDEAALAKVAVPAPNIVSR